MSDIKKLRKQEDLAISLGLLAILLIFLSSLFGSCVAPKQKQACPAAYNMRYNQGNTSKPFKF